ncbi:MAG: sporulation protein YqfD [Clostridia bacterium]|nr:sporulation protein YqfD [Clostridia bacterium]
MLFGNFKETLLLEGMMPERALLRLRRAGIGVYKAKKLEKTKLIFRVKHKDVQKVFTIYPNSCYQGATYSPYTVQRLGATGLGKYLEKAKSRVGLPLGGLLALIVLLLADSFVFAVEFVGTDVYKRETYELLERNGVRLFAPYKEGNEDGISAQLLRLSGVEYASVHKKGHRLIVELRTSPFSSLKFEQGAMQAKHTGELIALTVIRGTPLKKLGDRVTAGETLVEDRFYTQDGGQVRVEIIARACISCVYEAKIVATSEEEAFAKAYLSLSLTEKDRVDSHTVLSAKEKDVYDVTVRYTAIETVNF